MCGIVGFVGACPDRENVLCEMTRAIAHRGPDSENSYLDDGIALGFRRLSIIDLTTGSQPILNEDRTKVLIFNGEIYNYQALRADLVARGHQFTTRTDSEVLIHGYEEFGEALLPKLRGMFSFVIWDSVKRELFGARDSFGIKPMYYAQMGATFLFGSEIKAFLPHPHFVRELNEEHLSDYLLWNCVPGAEDTFFKNVRKLPPGHSFRYRDGALTIRRYFTPSFDFEPGKSFEYFVDRIADAVTESVIAHEISDVEVGCFLSSGVDSSYVTAEVRARRPVRTYTIGFEDPRYDEARNARMLADAIGVDNRVKIVSAADYFASVGEVQYHLDEPLANPSANALFFLSKLAAEDVKVVLSGEGADEMFAGYNIYKEPHSLAPYQLLPSRVRKGVARAAASLPSVKGKGYLLRGSRPVEDRYIGISNVWSPAEQWRVLGTRYPLRSPDVYTAPLYAAARHYDDVTKMQFLDINLWMVQEILLKADKMSMAHSLELRVPLLDLEIFRLARTIPPEYKVNRTTTKVAFRRAASRRIPEVSARRTKLAFPVPLIEWLRKDACADMVAGYFESSAASSFFERKELARLLDEHRRGTRSNASKIWNLFTFLVWHEQFFIKR
jgi:asparagine synthase (glutamine-hydrolysing)